MYIQPPFSIPKGYSGNAFAEDIPPEKSLIDEQPVEHDSEEEPIAPQEETDNDTQEEAVPANATPDNSGGILSRLPFLSSLLPPPRHKGKKSNSLSEWAIVGVFLLLMLEDNEQDLLPFLLLILLWD